MPDPMLIIAAISGVCDSLSKAIAIGKDLRNLKSGPELDEHLLEWRSQVIGLKDQVLSLREAMQDMKQENLDLRQKLNDREKELQQALIDLRGSGDGTSISKEKFTQLNNGLWEKDGRHYCPTCMLSGHPIQLVSELSGRLKKCAKCNFSFSQFGKPR